MPIRVLDAATVSRIAAGEVVERPSSIAKELIENALDAGSTSITVEVREGGVELLRVTDNGCGIPISETRVAFENHATSKLVSGDSLTDIRTLGFRGEALASISAVAKVEMRTRTHGAESGALVRVEGGSFLGIQETGCPEGTSVTVRDLFYNVPARKAFLRKPSYEAGILYDTVMRLMLGNPGVSIRLVGNGRNICHSYGDGSLRSAALAVFGRETASKMQEIDVSEGAFRIEGLVGVGDCAKQNRYSQYFFINGRSIRCHLLANALETAARERVHNGLHPICALHVHLPASAVDVNVHPSKLEVRFRDEPYFRQTAEALLLRALAADDGMLDVERLKARAEEADAMREQAQSVVSYQPRSVLEMTVQEKLARAAEAGESANEEGFAQMRRPLRPVEADEEDASGNKPEGLHSEEEFTLVRPPFRSERASASLREAPYERPIRQEPKRGTDTQKETGISNNSDKQTKISSVSEQPEQLTIPTTAPGRNAPSYRIIGVALRTYLILEADESLILIDQHAAHERIMYEQYKAQLDLGTASQRLLTPILLTLSPREIALLEENEEAIRDAGYEISLFGERDVRITAVPYILGKAEMRTMLPEMLDELYNLRGAQLDKRLHAIISLSCRKAIKGGDSLTQAEIESLVEAMLASGAPPTCPHGRPVARIITKNELEKMFWRT